jgi:Acyl-CoA oxidase
LSVEECLNLDILLDACAARAALLIKETVEAMQGSKATSREKDNELFA